MGFINVDLRFIDNELELDRLADFLGILEKQLDSAIKKEQKKAERLKKKDLDEDELWFIEQRLTDIVDNTLPRFFRSPFISSLWAVTESSITDVAKYIQKEENQKIKLKDLRGDNVLDRAYKYYDHILTFPLFNDNNVKNRLEMIRVLRNAIAHGNGRLDAINNEKDLKKIKKWGKDNIGIKVYDSIVLSDTFLTDSHKIINGALRALLKSVRMKYALKKKA